MRLRYGEKGGEGGEGRRRGKEEREGREEGEGRRERRVKHKGDEMEVLQET